MKQEVRYNVALRGVKRSVHGGASRSEPFDYFDHAREEAPSSSSTSFASKSAKRSVWVDLDSSLRKFTADRHPFSVWLRSSFGR